jgi:Pyridoxamine 5'-phosphate oxidase
MGQRYDALSEKHIQFIAEQKIFFVGTATADSRVNVSPKGMDALRVLGANRVVWLNLTGSGNETAAHVQQSPRMTLMFCSFTEEPLILRLYGTAKAIHRGDAEWAELSALFPPQPGARQIFDVAIDFVQSSCGFAVPYFDYQGERETLSNWAGKKSEAGIRQYWADKNQQSLDGIPTNVIEKSG